MSELHPVYHKIHNPFNLNMETKFRSIDEGWTKEEFAYLASLPWTATEKIDGTNVRVMWDGSEITFDGKTDNASMPGGLVQHLQSKFGTHEMLQAFQERFGESRVTIYGEGFGGKIQKGGSTYGPEMRFSAFDVRIGEWWLLQENFRGLMEGLEIPVAPSVYTAEGYWTAPLTAWIEMAQSGIESFYGPFTAEGLICKPTVELQTRNGERIVVKIKTRDFATAQAA